MSLSWVYKGLEGHSWLSWAWPALGEEQELPIGLSSRKGVEDTSACFTEFTVGKEFIVGKEFLVK